MLLRTFQLALPSLWHVGSVLFLVFVVFSILGLYLLGDAEHTGMIDSRINFETFGNSMFVLFTALTGENWPTVMRDLMVQVRSFATAPVPGYSNDSLVACHRFHGFPVDMQTARALQGKWEAIPFFMAFISIAFFVLLNLFLAVILDRFTETKRMEDYQLKQEDFKTFSEHWAVLDPNASLVIPAVKLEGFVLKLPTPLGIKVNPPFVSHIGKLLRVQRILSDPRP